MQWAKEILANWNGATWALNASHSNLTPFISIHCFSFLPGLLPCPYFPLVKKHCLFPNLFRTIKSRADNKKVSLNSLINALCYALSLFHRPTSEQNSSPPHRKGGLMTSPSWATWSGTRLERVIFFPVPKKQFSLTEQLPQMIYVASQEGLPGFLFHLGWGEELCWNFIREFRLNWQLPFVLFLEDLLFWSYAILFGKGKKNKELI